jgi:Cytochrome C oxidase, mono-heme subunit/FixO
VKGLAPLFLGLFGTFAFSWLGLTVIPNIQIGALSPQMDEEGTDVYCHSQQIRPDYVSADIDRKWGQRRSAPRDYLFDRPVQLGQQRMGPDLSNVGKRGQGEEEKPAAAPAANAPSASPAAAQPAPPQNAAAQKPAAGAPPAPANPPAQTAAASLSPSPSASPNPNGIPPMYSEAWHYRHLYSPRSMSPDNVDSTMPAYKFLFQKQPISGEHSADALQLTGADAPPPGWEVVPTYDAKCLVAYLMSLDQSHPLKEVRNVAASQPAGSPAAAAGSPAAAPASAKK